MYEPDYFTGDLIRPSGKLIYISLKEDPEIFKRTLDDPAVNILKEVEFRLAPSILPGLVSPQSIEHINNTASNLTRELGRRIDVDYFISYLPLSGCRNRWMPWDLFTGLSVEGIEHQILGPMLVSMNHRIMSHPNLDEDTKMSFLLSSLGQMQRDWRLTLFVTPTLKEGSFTIRSFEDNFPYLNCSLGKSTLHYFRGDKLTEDSFYSLYTNVELQTIALEISKAWGENFRRELALVEGSIDHTRASDFLELLLGKILCPGTNTSRLIPQGNIL